MPWENPVLVCLAVIAAVIFLLHIAHGLTLGRKVQHKEVTYYARRLPKEADGYRVVFFTDIHRYPAHKLEKLVEQANRRGFNLALLGGDFPGKKKLGACMEVLAGLDAPDGIYGVEGNHDNITRLGRAMRKNGIRLLKNQSACIRQGFYLSGLEDLRNRNPDFARALRGVEDNSFVLCLCHNPDVSMEQDISQADLMLSGHTHGGEVSLFGLWSPALYIVSRYGQRFRSGFCKSACATPVLVSHGIGRHFFLRIFVRPQIIYLTLKAK